MYISGMEERKSIQLSGLLADQWVQMQQLANQESNKMSAGEGQKGKKIL